MYVCSAHSGTELNLAQLGRNYVTNHNHTVRVAQCGGSLGALAHCVDCNYCVVMGLKHSWKEREREREMNGEQLSLRYRVSRDQFWLKLCV